MLSKYMRKLPEDIIQFVIIPFTYSPQPKEHLLEIRSFVSELRMVDSIYATQYNYNILLHDLLLYTKDITHIGENLNNTASLDEDRIYGYCRRIWGQLNTLGRSQFISRFILDDI